MPIQRRWLYPLLAIWLVPAIVLVIYLQRSEDSTGETSGHATHTRSRVIPWTGKSAAPSGKSTARTMREKMEHGETRIVDAKTLEHYLKEKKRNAESLVTAYRIGGKDPELLREARERFPDHPLVLQTALEDEQDATKRLGYLAALKRADPGNAMIGLMMADALFATGKREEALDELEAAASHPYDSYFREVWQAEEEAHLAMGMSPEQAKLSPIYSITANSVIRAKKVADELRKARESPDYAQDPEAVVSLRLLQQNIGRGLRTSGQNVVEQIVGISIEKASLLENGDPAAQEEIERLDALKLSMSDGARKVGDLMSSARVPDSDWLLYADRVKTFGEYPAIQWLLEKYPEQK